MSRGAFLKESVKYHRQMLFNAIHQIEEIFLTVAGVTIRSKTSHSTTVPWESGSSFANAS